MNAFLTVACIFSDVRVVLTPALNNCLFAWVNLVLFGTFLVRKAGLSHQHQKQVTNNKQWFHREVFLRTTTRVQLSLDTAQLPATIAQGGGVCFLYWIALSGI